MVSNPGKTFRTHQRPALQLSLNRRLPYMLKQRVVTAVVLLAVLLGALLAPGPWPLILLLVLAAVCGLWEWLRLTWPAQGSARPLFLDILSGAAIGRAHV